MTPDKASGVGLIAQGGALQPKKPLKVKCHNCGKTGHYPRNCCSPKREDMMQPMPSAVDKVEPKAKVNAWKMKPPVKDGLHAQPINDKQWL